MRVVPAKFDICMQLKLDGSSCGNPLEKSALSNECAGKLQNRTKFFSLFVCLFVFLSIVVCVRYVTVMPQHFHICRSEIDRSIDFTRFLSNAFRS